MFLSRLDLRGTPADRLAGLLPRPAAEVAFPTEAVRTILEQVRAGGDQALRELTARFDGVTVEELHVDPDEVRGALERVPSPLRRALEVAYERITAYHRHEPTLSGEVVVAVVVDRQLVRPVRRAGLYAPGGRARYPSTVLMWAVPATVAGVDELVLCVPPGPDGQVADETLAAAAIAGVDEVVRVGGAQAIAAMAYGTESIRPVDVIAGPGNRFVAEAKRQLSGVVGVPSAVTGPSEVVVVADGSADPRWAAVDLAVQAEHGPDGLAWLVTWVPAVADAVAEALAELVAGSPRRAELEATLGTGGYAVVVDGPAQAMAVANAVEPEVLLGLVRSAGAVFLGPWSPASVGDYLAGPNHVLPTARTARFASALRVDDFRTHIHAVSLDAPALRTLGPSVVTLAEAEGLPAHADSIRLRTERSAPGVPAAAGVDPGAVRAGAGEQARGHAP